MRVLVTGGTGTLGTALVPQLIAAGHDTTVMSRRPAAGRAVADLLTGDGLAAAVRGMDAVVHLASSPYRKTMAEVEVGGARRLLAAASDAGVGHLIYVSIVGVDRVPWGYYGYKVAAEKLVAASPVPWSILRATQFFQLCDRVLGAVGRIGVIPSDRGITVQPVDPRDVSGRLVDALAAVPSRRVEEYGGPEVLRFDEVARQWLAGRGKRRALLPLRIPGKAGRAFRAGALTTPAQPTGQITWREYLAGTGAVAGSQG
jgi:uncharacterized protein YbjT (DUF2867 family)